MWSEKREVRRQAIIKVRELVAAHIASVIKIRILVYFATPRKLSFALILLILSKQAPAS